MEKLKELAKKWRQKEQEIKASTCTLPWLSDRAVLNRLANVYNECAQELEEALDADKRS
jgi:sugar-specific transcriptional regulator TrmB